MEFLMESFIAKYFLFRQPLPYVTVYSYMLHVLKLLEQYENSA